MTGKIRLGELLVRAGVIDELKLKAALAEQQRWGGRLGRILVDMGFVSEDLLTKALSKQLGIARATFADTNIPAPILAKVPADFARSNACCPEHFDAARNQLTLAMADPTNVSVPDELRFKTGLRVEVTIAGEVQVSTAIDRIYGMRSGAYAPPEAIDLPPAGEPAAFVANQSHAAALAASGMPVELADGPPPWLNPGPPNAIPPPPPGPPVSGSLPVQTTTGPLQLNLTTGSLDVPRTNGHPGPVGLHAGFPSPQGGLRGPMSGAPGGSDGVARRLEVAQRQQHRAVQVMIDLLIEKGVFTRDEFAQLINRRGP